MLPFGYTAVLFKRVNPPVGVIRVLEVSVDVITPLVSLDTLVTTNIAVEAVSGCKTYVTVAVPTKVDLELLVYLLAV